MPVYFIAIEKCELNVFTLELLVVLTERNFTYEYLRFIYKIF